MRIHLSIGLLSISNHCLNMCDIIMLICGNLLALCYANKIIESCQWVYVIIYTKTVN